MAQLFVTRSFKSKSPPQPPCGLATSPGEHSARVYTNCTDCDYLCLRGNYVVSESLNQGWNEAITELALRGLKRAHVWASALSRFLSCSYLQSVSLKRNNSRATAKADTQLESRAGTADNTHTHTHTHTHTQGSFFWNSECQCDQMQFHTLHLSVKGETLLAKESNNKALLFVSNILSVLAFVVFHHLLYGAQNLYFQ